MFRMRDTVLGLCRLIAGAGVLFGSCGQEPTLPRLRPINEAVITGMDSLYLIAVHDKLTIVPSVSFTQDKVQSDTSRYRYEWIFILQPPTGSEYPYRTIGTGKSLVDYDLAADIHAVVGVYDFTFRITDTGTDTFTEFPFRVIMGTDFYEGWVVLHEASGQAHLDMLSYQPHVDTFVRHPGVLSFPARGSGVHGNPVFVECIFESMEGLSLGGILVGTDSALLAFSEDHLQRMHNYYERYWALAALSDGERLRPRFYGQMYDNHLLIGQTAFRKNFETSGVFRPISVRETEGGEVARFPAGAYLGVDQRALFDVTVLFDEQADEFVWYNSESERCFALGTVNRFDRERRWSLSYLAHTRFGGGQYFAVMRDEENGAIHETRFTLYEQLHFTQVSPGSLLPGAECQALDPNAGRFYFSVGNTLYEYTGGGDRKVKEFDQRITMLKFEQYLMTGEYMTGSSVNKRRYHAYEALLMVATHDGARPAHSGRYMLYDPARDRISQEHTGFGRIVDVTYKER